VTRFQSKEKEGWLGDDEVVVVEFEDLEPFLLDTAVVVVVVFELKPGSFKLVCALVFMKDVFMLSHCWTVCWWACGLKPNHNPTANPRIKNNTVDLAIVSP
jgi:hypothetical protein